MALPSQTERSNEMNRPVMAGRRAGPVTTKTAVIGVAALVVLAGGVWGLMQLLPSSTPDAASAQPVGDVTSANGVAPAPRSLLGDAPAQPSGVQPIAANNSVATQAPAPRVVIDMSPSARRDQATPTSTPGTPIRTPNTDPTKPNAVDVSRPDLRPNPAPPAAGGAGTSIPALPNSGTPGTGGSGGTALLPSTNATSAIATLIESGDRALAANRLVEARSIYSRALLHIDAARADQDVLRQKLTTVNEDLLFSAKIDPSDPLVEAYTVVSGDSLERIRRKRDLAVDWRLIQRVNRISNPSALKIGQKLKLVRGPFHAIVHKADYRVDLFTGSPDDPENWLYIRSFRAGLGDGNSTPVGTFVIKKNSKLINPPWVNPRTGERFAADDPKNPIGEHWLGWQGVGESSAYTGFGIHGTIDPSSIGSQRSMGCVRLAAEDIAMVYELLVEQISVVKVVP